MCNSCCIKINLLCICWFIKFNTNFSEVQTGNFFIQMFWKHIHLFSYFSLLVHNSICARFGLPKEHAEKGVYIAKGSMEVAQQIYSAGQMLVFNKGADPLLIAKEHATLMLLGGEPVGDRYIWWNFVHSREERIEQAKEDWNHGRIVLPPIDNKEFIPLPEDCSRPAGGPQAEPLS